jgi:SsrA-binding protein
MRPRRLLMHKREIMKLSNRVKQDGFSLIPLSLYFKGPLVKVELGVCKGKKLHDKRDAEAKKDAVREIERSIKDH